MQVLRRLMLSHGQRHLRDLAKDSSLSPAGVSDILRRFKEVGALSEKRVGNRRCLRLKLSDEERDCLKAFFLVQEHTVLRQRSSRFSQGASERLKWMDETYEFYHRIKKARRDPT
jgi:DNA-binding MarR family transcriptional regulator